MPNPSHAAAENPAAQNDAPIECEALFEDRLSSDIEDRLSSATESIRDGASADQSETSDFDYGSITSPLQSD